MRSKPGRELTCQAHNYRFHENGAIVEQGVISYFASRAMAKSETMGEWFEAITAALNANHDLPPLRRPELQLAGAGSMRLP